MADIEQTGLSEYESQEAEIELIGVSLEAGNQADISTLIDYYGKKKCPLEIFQKYGILKKIKKYGKKNKEAQKLKKRIEIMQFKRTKKQLVKMLKEDTSESSASPSESEESWRNLDLEQLKLEHARTQKRYDELIEIYNQRMEKERIEKAKLFENWSEVPKASEAPGSVELMD